MSWTFGALLPLFIKELDIFTTQITDIKILEQIKYLFSTIKAAKKSKLFRWPSSQLAPCLMVDFSYQ